jgi:hypothetical protein
MRLWGAQALVGQPLGLQEPPRPASLPEEQSPELSHQPAASLRAFQPESELRVGPQDAALPAELQLPCAA